MAGRQTRDLRSRVPVADVYARKDKVPRVLTSAYKMNLPSKALQILIFASGSLQA